MPNEERNVASTEDNSAKLRRVIEHADASVARWSTEKRQEATLTFYSRSSEPRALNGNTSDRRRT